MSAVRRRLEQGLRELDLAPGPAACTALEQLIGLLARWNRAYNLTSVRDPGEMVAVHLLDSLAVRPWIDGDRVLDVGTGGGFPGLPLAICAPRQDFVLLDSVAKKIRFVRQAALELGLGNVTAVHARVEDYPASEAFDTVTCRAFSSLAELVDLAGPRLRDTGRLVLMKGRYPEAELAECPSGWVVREVTPLAVPGLDAQRHVVIVQRSELD